jgi:hypothetical protein
MQDGAQKEKNSAPAWPVWTQIYLVAMLAGCAVLAALFTPTSFKPAGFTRV